MNLRRHQMEGLAVLVVHDDALIVKTGLLSPLLHLHGRVFERVVQDEALTGFDIEILPAEPEVLSPPTDNRAT